MCMQMYGHPTYRRDEMPLKDIQKGVSRPTDWTGPSVKYRVHRTLDGTCRRHRGHQTYCHRGSSDLGDLLMGWEVAIATGGRINNYRGSSDSLRGHQTLGWVLPLRGSPDLRMGWDLTSYPTNAAERQPQTGGHQTHFGLGVIRTTPKDNIAGGQHTHVGLGVI